MAYLRKEDVLANIKTRQILHRGARSSIFEAYLGTDIITKRPVRIASSDIEKLRKKVAAFYKRRSSGGDIAVMLSPEQAMDARLAYDIIRSENLNSTLVECVKSYIEAQKTAERKCTVTLSAAYAKYLLSQEGKSTDHIDSVERRVGKWVECFGADRLLSDVTAPELAEELEKRICEGKGEKAKTTYNNHLGYIKTFMRWCSLPEQGYIEKSPIATLSLKKKGWRDKEYLHSQDCRKLFAYLYEHREKYATDLAYAILSFMCGMRNSEISRTWLGPSAIVINLEERFIRVVMCKGATKGVRPRVFTIPDMAYKWMQSFDFMDAVIKRNSYFRSHLVAASKAAGIDNMPENCGRHTFCTMFDAAYHDQVKLSAIAGNSEDVRAKHYNGLATEKEGKDFFTILPPMG